MRPSIAQMTLEQKSVSLMVLNTSMVMRSIGKKVKDVKRRKKVKMAFKKALYKAVSSLMGAIAEHKFTTDLLRDEIGRLVDTDVSFGQAQKAVNIILKYQYYLAHPRGGCDWLARELDCPIDSGVFRRLQTPPTKLLRLKRGRYKKLQALVAKRSRIRLTFDKDWDTKFVKRNGWQD